MLNLITTCATYLFPGGRAIKLVKDGINVTNSTIILTKNITLVVTDCCAPPLLRLAAHWVVAGSFNSYAYSTPQVRNLLTINIKRLLEMEK